MNCFASILICLVSCTLLISAKFELNVLKPDNNIYSISCHLKMKQAIDYEYGLILINAKHLYQYNNINQNILINNLPPNNRYSIAIYFVAAKSIKLISSNSIDIIQKHKYKTISNYKNQYTIINFHNNTLNTLTAPRMSTYYSTINVIDAQAWQNISFDMKSLGYKNTIPPNIETAIRSNNIITIYDLRQSWAWTQAESKINSSIKPVQQDSSFYHERPSQFGYYCLFYNRPNQHLTPDCPNVTNILTEHAKMLQSSGIDFIALDDTNLDSAPVDPYSDILQLRPAEIIYENWNDLRNKSGTNTPDIVTWNKANGIEWKSYLNLYAQYPNMVLTVPDTNDNNKLKKVFFYPQNSDANNTVVNMIAYNNGKNNILTQGMWGGGGMSEKLILNGTWTFFYPCRYKQSDGTYKQSVSMESLTECNFVMTQNSPIGSQISASMAWQNNYGSLPFSSPSKLNGRTFLLIIQDVLSMKPQNVLFPSFNEHTALGFDGSSKAAFGGNNTWGVGLAGDVQRSTKGFFVDTYGSERSRSIEPTDESGDYYYRLMQSCIRVIKLAYKYFELDIILRVKDSNKICNIVNEICCNELQNYVDVWSLYKPISNDYIVSNSITEVNEIIEKDGYKQICSPSVYSDSTVFCMNNNDLNTFNAHRGPFIVYKDLNNPIDGSYADINIDRIAIYRCITSNGYHFIANQSDCDGISGSKMEYIIGYVAIEPSTAMPRRLVRCQNSQSKYYYHVVDDQCLTGDISSAILGYVFG
eukprot:465873_1